MRETHRQQQAEKMFSRTVGDLAISFTKVPLTRLSDMLAMDEVFGVRKELMLNAAAFEGNLSMVRTLLAAKADPSSYSNSALRAAAINDNHEIVKILLEDPRVDRFDAHNAAISIALSAGSIESAKLLMDHANVNIGICLDVALQYKHVDLVHFIMKQNKLQAYSFILIFKKAVEHGWTKIVRCILRWHSSTIFRDNQKWKYLPLILTASKKPAILKMLMSCKNFIQNYEAGAGEVQDLIQNARSCSDLDKVLAILRRLSHTADLKRNFTFSWYELCRKKMFDVCLYMMKMDLFDPSIHDRYDTGTGCLSISVVFGSSAEVVRTWLNDPRVMIDDEMSQKIFKIVAEQHSDEVFKIIMADHRFDKIRLPGSELNDLIWMTKSPTILRFVLDKFAAPGMAFDTAYTQSDILREILKRPDISLMAWTSNQSDPDDE